MSQGALELGWGWTGMEEGERKFLLLPNHYETAAINTVASPSSQE